MQIKNVLDNFKGKNGVGKAVASWAGVIIDGVQNFSSNKDEQANSNGTMTEARVFAETISETAVGTVIKYGAGAIIGAAVTTVIGSVPAAGLVVVAATGFIITGIDAGVQAITGKNTIEFISDTILDAGEAIGECAVKAVHAVGGWFK